MNEQDIADFRELESILEQVHEMAHTYGTTPLEAYAVALTIRHGATVERAIDEVKFKFQTVNGAREFERLYHEDKTRYHDMREQLRMAQFATMYGGTATGRQVGKSNLLREMAEQASKKVAVEVDEQVMRDFIEQHRMEVEEMKLKQRYADMNDALRGHHAAIGKPKYYGEIEDD